MLFCSAWIAQIRDFKNLNNAKFSFLNEMAPRLAFDRSEDAEVVSYEPFAREWESLKKAQAIQEISETRILALKSSNLGLAGPPHRRSSS